MNLKFAISPCPNDIYIFAGLILKQVKIDGVELDFLFKDIQDLNNIALQKNADVVKISAANLFNVQSDFRLIPCGGALGRKCGPLLLKNPQGESEQNEIYIPGELTTAHFLFNFYQKENVKKKFLPYDELYSQLKNVPGSRGVVIHESRFVYKRDGLELVQDLGEYWEEKTGYPIPLGVIVCHGDKILSDSITDGIRKSILWAKDNELEVLNLCKEYAQELDEEVILSHIQLYVNDFSYDMGDQGREAVQFLLENSH